MLNSRFDQLLMAEEPNPNFSGRGGNHKRDGGTIM